MLRNLLAQAEMQTLTSTSLRGHRSRKQEDVCHPSSQISTLKVAKLGRSTFVDTASGRDSSTKWKRRSLTPAAERYHGCRSISIRLPATLRVRVAFRVPKRSGSTAAMLAPSAATSPFARHFSFHPSFNPFSLPPGLSIRRRACELRVVFFSYT